jgi:hypothetical protein
MHLSGNLISAGLTHNALIDTGYFSTPAGPGGGPAGRFVVNPRVANIFKRILEP